jgi:hypothetical protein
MTVPANPFVMVYDSVWNLLFGGVENQLAASIKVGNRITLGSELATDRNPFKNTSTTSDYPELILVDEGGQMNLHANSSQMSYLMQLSIYISSNDLRYGVVASNLNWYTCCNLAKWRDLLNTVQWREKSIIKGFEIIPITIGPNNPQHLNAPVGWNSIWRAQFKLHIDHVDLVYSGVV